MMVQHQTQWDIWLSLQSVKDYYTDLMIENLTFFTPVSLESGVTEACCVLYGLPASSSDT